MAVAAASDLAIRCRDYGGPDRVACPGKAWHFLDRGLRLPARSDPPGTPARRGNPPCSGTVDHPCRSTPTGMQGCLHSWKDPGDADSAGWSTNPGPRPG